MGYYYGHKVLETLNRWWLRCNVMNDATNQRLNLPKFVQFPILVTHGGHLFGMGPQPHQGPSLCRQCHFNISYVVLLAPFAWSRGLAIALESPWPNTACNKHT